MEREDEAKIRANLPTLIEVTECNIQLLIQLVNAEVISYGDFDKLRSYPAMVERAVHFYRILVTRNGAYQALLDALRHTGQSDALGVLENATGTGTSFQINYARRLEEIRQHDIHQADRSRASLPFNLKDPSPLFTGREQELLTLHGLITAPSSADDRTVIAQMARVSGLGGIGKTQLARKYAQIFGHEYFYDNVIWIEAESSEKMRRNFIQLAQDNLHISTRNADGGDRNLMTIVNDCYHRFKHSKALFVFDNADNVDTLEPYLPNANITPGVRVLITSRNRVWGSADRVIDLKVFEVEDAIELVKKGLGDKDDIMISEMELLVKELHYFPLALQQAIAYIKNERFSKSYGIKDYLKEYKQKKLLGKKVSDVGDDYTMTTLTTWLVTMAKIKQFPYGHKAIELLELIAYFEPERIPRETLLHYDNYKEGDVDEAIKLLFKYSLIDLHEEHSVLSIHRLVQQVVQRDKGRNKVRGFRAFTDFCCLNWQKYKIWIFRKAFGLFTNFLNETNISHAISVWKHACKFPTLLANFAYLLLEIICKLRDFNWFQEGISFGKMILPKLQDLLPTLQWSRFISEFEEIIGEIHIQCGQHDTALKILLQVYDQKQRDNLLPSWWRFLRFETEDTNTKLVSTMYNIGCAIFNQGRHTEGLDLCTSACFQLWESTAPRGQFRVILPKITMMACRVGAFQLVITLIQMSTNLQQTNFQKDTVWFYRNGMIGAMRQAGLGDQMGLNLFRGLCDQLNSIKNSPSTEMAGLEHELLENFAVHLFRYKEYQEGLQVSQKLYNLCKKRLGEDHISTIQSHHLLTTFKLEIKNPAEEALLQVSKGIYDKLKEGLGENHRSTLYALGTVGLAQSRQGHNEAALETYNLICQGFMKCPEGNTDDFLSWKLAYAEVLESGGLRDEAWGVLEQVNEVCSSKFGQNHPIYRNSVEAIRRIYAGLQIA